MSDQQNQAVERIIARTGSGVVTDQEARDEIDALAEMPTHVDERGIRYGRLGEETARFFLAAGYRKHPEPEWEYGVTSKWGIHEHPYLAGAERYAAALRAEIEQGRSSGDLTYHGHVMKRAKAKAGPWVPVDSPEPTHRCDECQTCGVHGGIQLKCCGCYDGVCCQDPTTPTEGGE